MSFCTEKITRATLTLIVGLTLLAGATGCSTFNATIQTVKGWWPFGKDAGSAASSNVPEGVADLFEEPPAAEEEPVLSQGEGEILRHWETITGGVYDADGAWGKARHILIGAEGIQLQRPVAIAVRDEYVYIVDAGLDLLLRYNLVSGSMSPVLELSGHTAGEVPDIYVTADYSFYLADEAGKRVLYFDAKGRRRRVFQNALNLVRPVGVVEDARTGKVLVADAQFDHILVFNKDGELESAIGGRGSEPGQFLNITAMAEGPDGFYVGARVGQRVQVLSPDGVYLYSLPQETVVFPLAIAVDPDFRAFVSDYMDNTIKVYVRGNLVNSYGGTGIEPGKFKRITDLTLAGEFLYAADSLNGRIQVMKVAGEAGPISSPLDLPGGTAVEGKGQEQESESILFQ